jgi:hypothetical protein
MKYFAKLDENNNVLNIVVVDDDACSVDMAPEGETYCQNLFNGGNWKQTSPDGSFRKRKACKYGTYDPVNDVFIDEKEFNSWTLDSDFAWQAPVTYPSNQDYPHDNDSGLPDVYPISWDEENQRWLGTARMSEQNLVWNSTSLSWEAL